MTTMIDYPHITKEPGAPARLQSHPRTRVAMIVMDYLARGLGPEDMVRHYPYLQLAEIHAAMAYYHDHRDEIDAKSSPNSTNLNTAPTPIPSRRFGSN